MLQGGLLGIQASPATLAGEASEDSYGEVGSAFLRNADPTSQLAAHSTTHSHGSAFCCIVCYQKQGLSSGFSAHPAVRVWEGGLGFQFCCWERLLRTSTHMSHINTYAHPCTRMLDQHVW